MANNDLSFTVSALNRASQTFTEVATQIDKVSAKLDELDGKDVSAEVKVGVDDTSVEDAAAKLKAAADEMGGTASVRMKLDDGSVVSLKAEAEAAGEAAGSSAGEGLQSGAGPGVSGMGVLIAAGLLVGAPLVAGAATALGVGAMAALAVGLNRNNAGLMASLNGVERAFETTAKTASQGMIVPLEAGFDQLGAFAKSLGPELSQAFTAAAQGISPLLGGLESLVSGALPGFTHMLQQAGPILDGVRSLFAATGQVAAAFFDTIATHSSTLGNGLHMLGTTVTELGKTLDGLFVSLGDLWQLLGPVINGILTAVAGLAGALANLMDGVVRATQSTTEFTQGIAGLDPAVTQFGEGITGMTQATGGFTAGIAGLNQGSTTMGRSLSDATSKATDNATATSRAAQMGALLGESASQAAAQMQQLVGAQGNATASSESLAAQLDAGALAMAQSASAITTHFTAADQAVSQAEQSVGSASYAVTQAQQGIASAQHSAEQATLAVSSAMDSYASAQHNVVSASEAVEQANQGVTNAEHGLSDAYESETNAQNALNVARVAAIENLKSLQLQLNDSVASQYSNNVSLFDAQTAASALGVTPGNANAIASEQVTAANEAQVKTAIALLQAQNSVNDGLDKGTQLQQSLNTAQQQGVNGNPGVVSAQQALDKAIQGVLTAQQSLTTAQQGAANAEYSLVQSHKAVAVAAQGVTDAEYSAQQAHQAVSAAVHSEQTAVQSLTQAQNTLTLAQGSASRSLDINTVAGQQNMSMLQQLNASLLKNEPAAQAYHDLIKDTAVMFGGSTSAAAGYLKQLGLIPQNYQYNVTAVAGVNWSNLNSWTSGSTDQKGLSQTTLGSIFGHATGGHITGPGGPRDDVIPAMLSNGEYVVNAGATAQHKPLLDAINYGKYANGGPVDAKDFVGTYLGTSYMALANATNVVTPGAMALLPQYVAPAAPTAGGGSGGQINYAAGAGVAQWASVITQALGMLGQPASWLGTVERRMNQESGGNPNAVNLWDSNAKAGTPSVGLMQVIGPTFRSNAGQFQNTGPFSYGVSTDPLANTFAGLHYALGRYGSLSALNRAGGYAAGGPVQSASAASGGNQYHLTVHNAANQSVDLSAQFKRMEIMSGL